MWRRSINSSYPFTQNFVQARASRLIGCNYLFDKISFATHLREAQH